MTVEERVNTLEGEFKLIKGEMRQSLVDVRDFLVNLKMPVTAEDTILSHKEETETSNDGDGDKPPERPQMPPEFPALPEQPEAKEDQAPSGWQPPEQQQDQPFHPPQQEQHEPAPAAPWPAFPPMPQAPPRQNQSSPPMPEPPAPPYFPAQALIPRREEPQQPRYGAPEHIAAHTEIEKESPRPAEPDPDPEPVAAQENEMTDQLESESREGEGAKDVGSVASVISVTGSRVNMMANLARWVATAKAELGSEQLPTFLDLYAVAAQMPAQLKETILKMAQVIGEKSGSGDAADVWSRLTLELHGILSGGDPSGFAAGPGVAAEEKPDEEPGESEKEEDLSPRLKIVLPTGKGEKEFVISLAPEPNGNGKHPKPA